MQWLVLYLILGFMLGAYATWDITRRPHSEEEHPVAEHPVLSVILCTLLWPLVIFLGVLKAIERGRF